MDKVLTAEDDDHGIPADPRDEVLIWEYVRLMLGNQVELMRTPKGLGRFHGSRASSRRTSGSRAMGSPGTSAAACKTQQEVQLPCTPEENGLWSMSRIPHSESSDCVVCMVGDHEDYGDDLWEEAPTGSPARGSPGRIMPPPVNEYTGSLFFSCP